MIQVFLFVEREALVCSREAIFELLDYGRLIALYRKEVVASALKDLLCDLPLAAQGIKRNEGIGNI